MSSQGGLQSTKALSSSDRDRNNYIHKTIKGAVIANLAFSLTERYPCVDKGKITPAWLTPAKRKRFSLCMLQNERRCL